MTMIRQKLFTGLLLSLLVSLFVATAAEAAEPNEAQVLSRKSQHQSQHHANIYPENETTSLIAEVEPTTSADAEVEVFNLRQSQSDTSDSLEWPWNNKKDDSDKEDRTCQHYANCSTCSYASWCHWCGKDCHVIGSVYGCVTAASCDKPEKKNETDPSGCGAHDSCSKCAISSHLCHWCAHDNACHSVGSYYGCVNGVDCYSNDICKRKEPEAITDTVFTMIGPVPLLVLVTLSALLLCCASTCFCVAGGVKGAYDDLAGIHADNRAAPNEPLLQQPQQHQQQSRMTVIAETPEPVTTAAAAADPDAEQVGREDTTNTADEEGNNAIDYARMAEDDGGEGADAGEDAPLLAVVPQQQRTTRRPYHMQRLYHACTVCYIATVAVIVVSLYGAVHYFPTKPQYNICNDNVAWKSLIDSMTSMSVNADFEILASVNNPNYFDVELDMGKGSFQHDGAFVGTFDIPPVTVKAMSVTDLMIIAHFSPEKWSALSITAEYYEGKLILHVDAQVSARVPALFDYTISTELNDLVVHVNELSDRHLCACPNWSEARNNTSWPPRLALY